MTIHAYSGYEISKYGLLYIYIYIYIYILGNAQASKGREKGHEDIKVLEKWVRHSSAHPKANWRGFVVASGIWVPLNQGNQTVIHLFFYFFTFLFPCVKLQG